ncbi:MAG: ferredoxin [Myxococcota bacterium]|nr:ferredoxin [Myxococcota bacterium]
MARVRVDPEKCVGHGRCYVLAPDVFEEDERGYCVIPREEVAPELEVQARLGEGNCPEHAITVDEG